MRRAVLVAALLVLLVGPLPQTAALNKHKEKHHPKYRHSSFKRDTDQPAWSLFEQQDKDYCFDYNAQIASGYAPWISTQKAMSRLQCRVCFNFQRDQSVLRIENVRIGQRNQPPSPTDEEQEWNAAQIFDIQSFNLVDRETARKMKSKLQMPVHFQYIEGSVERIQFDEQDKPWSKNIKKAVLNLIQMNLNQQQIQPEEEDYTQGKQDSSEYGDVQEASEKSARKQEAGDIDQWISRTFTTNEATLEGTCETTYTILSSSPKTGVFKEVNITKTINFNKCQQVADVSFGFQVEPLNRQQWQRTQLPRKEEEQQGRVVPQEKLDRSTTIRYVLGKQGESEFVLKRVESLSEYVMKSSQAESSQAMQTVAVAELAYRQGETHTQQIPSNVETDASKEETLLYNVEEESLQKQFYMYGDDKFTGDNIPFPFHRKDTGAIVVQAEHHLHKLVQAFEEENIRNGGIDTSQSIEHFERLVEVMRMCSVEELKQLDSKSAQFGSFGRQNAKENTASDLFADALAVAATRNTIAHLAEKIKSEVADRKMSEMKAALLLKVLGRGAGLPAPSDAQCDTLLALCNSDLVQQKREGEPQMLKQSCWLTFGTLVGELNQQSWKAKLMGHTESPMKASEQTEKSKLDLYTDVLIKQFDQAGEDVYEKILALKAIGNAGLKSTLGQLKKVMHDSQQPPMVRIQAIDALRRLRHHLPGERLQAIVLPIYQNTKEHSEVRIGAFSTVMQTRPSTAVVDQIAFTMANEKSRDVQGFVYSAIRAQAQSPMPEERKRADHLRSVLKLAQINEEQLQTMGASRRYSRPVYSEEQQEGAFLNFISVFGARSESALPSHVSLGLDTFFNGQFNRNALKVTVCQKDIEQLARQLFSEGPVEPTEGEKQKTEQQKQGFFSRAAQQLRSLVGKLKIKGRQPDDEQPEPEELSPFVVVSVRLNDVDVLMVPINMDDSSQEHSTINRVKKVLSTTWNQIFSHTQSRRFQMNSAVVLNSRIVSVPTSIGMGLKVSQSMYLLGQVRTMAQTERHGQEDKVKVVLHPNLNWLQTQKMETRMMTLSSGVQSNRAVEVNLPLEAALKDTRSSKAEKKLKLSVQVPEQKTRLLAVHSLPSTFIAQLNDFFRHQNSSMRYYNRLQTVHNQQLQKQFRELHQVVGKEGVLGVPLKLQAQFHEPRQMLSLKEWLKVIMTGDNHLSVELDPREGRNTPREIALTVMADVFQGNAESPASSLKTTFKDFYSKLSQRISRTDSANDQQYSTDSNGYDSDEEWERRPRGIPAERRHQQSKRDNAYLEKFAREEKRNYKHSAKILLEAIGGGSQGRKIEGSIDAVCDAKLRACEAKIKAERSGSGNTGPFKIDAKVQTLYPEHVQDARELLEQEGGKHQKFLCNLQAHWGVPGQQEQMEVNVQGEPSEQMRRHIFQSQEQQRQFRAYSDDGSRETGLTTGRQQQRSRRDNQLAQSKLFIDQYQMVVEYTLKPSTLYKIRGQLEALKSRNFWNTESRLVNQDQSPYARSGLQQGQAECSLWIDPVTARHANLSIETPVQQIFIRQMELPCKMRPMRLVRPQLATKGSHSTRQLVSRLFGGTQGGPQGQKAQCKVGPKTVDTFDGMSYKAPVSKCYTVLAKDCSHKGEPMFAVLLRSLEVGTQQKKIKVIVPGKEITVQPEEEQPNKMRIKVNDQVYTVAKGQDNQEAETQLRKEGIELEIDSQDRQSVTIDALHVTVKFNGETAQVQISEKYKNTQCGLCGNYNDDRDDELRTNDDELTDDVQRFHRSYALKDQQDGECEEEEHRQFYGDNKKANFQQKQKQKEVNPVERTVMMEYSHKVCFSQQPVKQCPEGWAPRINDAEEGETMRKIKAHFTCLDRKSLEVKRLRAEIRRSQVAHGLEEYSLSFVEEVAIPEMCTLAE